MEDISLPDASSSFLTLNTNDTFQEAGYLHPTAVSEYRHWYNMLFITCVFITCYVNLFNSFELSSKLGL